MLKRTKLADRQLPNYSTGEEIMNTVTHIVGGAMGVAALTMCVMLAAQNRNIYGVIGSSIYGFCMIALYSVSSVYHGLRPGMGKKVMQVIDHCTIYLLIAGTYTPILLSAIRPTAPVLAWVIFGVEWGLVAFAVVFTAIDHNRYAKLSMICYLGMGWCIIVVLRATLAALTLPGFLWILSGGIAYTVGAALYGVGHSRHIFHTVFHVFVVAGSLLQAVGILLYAL